MQQQHHKKSMSSFRSLTGYSPCSYAWAKHAVLTDNGSRKEFILRRTMCDQKKDTCPRLGRDFRQVSLDLELSTSWCRYARHRDIAARLRHSNDWCEEPSVRSGIPGLCNNSGRHLQSVKPGLWSCQLQDARSAKNCTLKSMEGNWKMSRAMHPADQTDCQLLPRRLHW